MNNIYKDIAERTNGNIYIGVVGPVRTGKSTFISQFVQQMVLPNISDENDKKRAMDELPQSADGKMIMTTQPKFVPDKAISINLTENSTANVRLIDCVGYVVEGAEGHTDDGKTRLVNTPWSTEPIPFEKAAEIGTRKVATEHSTVAIVITTDGSIGDIPRKNYVMAEERVIAEIKQCGKPFVVVLNTATPGSESVQSLCVTLSEKYGVKVIPLNVATCNQKDFEIILQQILGEFSVRRIALSLPNWMRALPRDNKVICSIMDSLKDVSVQIDKMKDSDKLPINYSCDYISSCQIEKLDYAKGVVHCNLIAKENLFFQILSEEAGVEISDEFSLMNYITASAYTNKRFSCMRDALDEADANGYGIVYPLMDKMTLDEPHMIRQGSIYGVRLKAVAPSYHIIKVDVSTEVSPMVGTEQQSQYLLEQYKQNPEAIWNTNMFGKTMSGIARDGLTGKCTNVPLEVKQKLTKTVGRIVNENKGGLICILL